MAKRSRTKFIFKIIISLIVVLGTATGLVAYHYYSMIYLPNISVNRKNTAYFYIPTGSSFNDVANSLSECGFIINRNSFSWVAERKKYKNAVKPGRYLIKEGMSNNDLVNLLRSGEQEPINLTLNNVRLRTELAGQISRQIEADSISVLNLLNNEQCCTKYGFTNETFLTMFIPNTYQFYWNTSAEEFVSRMAKEYKNFWNSERAAKAQKTGLTQSEVSILAAIVQKETSKSDEKPMVAKVYLNRLQKGMLLQADPTLIFALGDFTVHRVLNKHKEIDSPYNTYMYKGLPPGPICLPEISSIDAVLNHPEHDYLFFCAKEDFSGYHNFAKNYAQHKLNALKWQRALNKEKIYR